MGRVAAGVRGIDLREGDVVVGAAVVNRNASFLSVCAKGYGKRSSFDDYRIQSRGGKGIINYKTTDKTGKVVAAKSIFEGDEIMLMTRQGVVLRTTISEASMREIGRATQGVRMMKIADDEVSSVVKIMNEAKAFDKAEAEEGERQVDEVIAKGIEEHPADSARRKGAEDETPAEPPKAPPKPGSPGKQAKPGGSGKQSKPGKSGRKRKAGGAGEEE